MGVNVKLGGLNVKVVSDAEAATADVAVCMRKGFDSPFSDNLEGTCCSCARAVIFRPHLPKGLRKMCFECAQLALVPPVGTA